MTDKSQDKDGKRKLSTLLALVLFVFIILFISVVLAGAISATLLNMGVLPSLSANRFPATLVFLLLVSLLIGTVMALIGGDVILRPLRNLTDATKEIASGNYNVRVEPRGVREISSLAKSFNDMAKELSGVEKLRDDFMSNISHEFKTPIVSIRGFARRLKKNTLTEEQREEYLDIIISETERLTRLSGNILLLSKLENMDLLRDENAFYLDEQLRRAVLLLEPQAVKKQLEIDIDLTPVRITANEEMLQHVWLNILDNAVKFSPQGGLLKVTLSEENGEAVASVSDSGSGMSGEERLRVFEKFFQGDASRSTEGNGLGLALVKRIVELSGGQISIESEIGKGTRFEVRLPKGDDVYRADIRQ